MRISSGITGKPPVRAYVFALLALAACAGWGIASPAVAATLNPAVLPTIQSATFEVVEAKPAKDPLTYEKPLPLDLLPYQERIDKYHSIGTAFALGHNRYVTAGHVLMAGVGSLWGPPELRDASGHVYAIDKIEKFSLRKDFVVFSLVSPPPGDAALTVDTKPALNQVVYAVGNALGTGVVIRDGLYTSDTPEQQDGQWKWMRFSAAASPGNSGGPLLDQDGKVIGVVLMKSANENLNYALPISEVLDAPDDLAVIDKRIPYQFDMFDSTLDNLFKEQFALPLGLGDFFHKYQKLSDAYGDGQLKALLDQQAPNTFPRGAGSARLLHNPVAVAATPALIVRDSDGTWNLALKPSSDNSLPANGRLSFGRVGANLLFHLRRPDDVPVAKLRDDPGSLMDLLLKSGFVTRTTASEKIKVTSLGQPTRDSMYTDAWQRRWRLLEWPVPYANAYTFMLAMPVPDGYVGLIRVATAAQEHDYRSNLLAFADFMFVSFNGTLAQWKSYLADASAKPAVLKGIDLHFDYGHRFSYASRRLRFAFTPQLQAIAPDSRLMLDFSFFDDHGKPVWDVSTITVLAHDHIPDAIHIRRIEAPTPELDDAYRSHWEQLAARRHPFDGIVAEGNDQTAISTVIGPPASQHPPLLYVVSYQAEGSHPQAGMKTKLGLAMKDLRVMEH